MIILSNPINNEFVTLKFALSVINLAEISLKKKILTMSCTKIIQHAHISNVKK